MERTDGNGLLESEPNQAANDILENGIDNKGLEIEDSEERPDPTFGTQVTEDGVRHSEANIGLPSSENRINLSNVSNQSTESKIPDFSSKCEHFGEAPSKAHASADNRDVAQGICLETGAATPDPASTSQFEGDFDELLSLVGEFGRLQWRLFFLFQLPFVSLAMLYFGQIWLLLEPDHWCRVPALERRGWSPQQVRNLTAPPELAASQLVPSSCRVYDVDFNVINPETWLPGNNTKIVPCQHGWHFDFSFVYPTIVSDLQWVCDDAWKATLSTTLFFVGSVVGTLLFSELADRFGRLPTLVAAHVFCGLAGFASAFAASLPVFGLLRFLYGFGNANVMVQALVLLTEFVGPRYRSMVSNVPLATSFCFTMIAMPWVAKALGHWKYMAMATSLPMLLAVCYYLLNVPESCRWLQHKGRIDQAITIMRRVAAENGRHVPEQTWAEFTAAARRNYELEKQAQSPSLLDMMRLPRLRRRMLLLVAGSWIMFLQFDLIARSTEFGVGVYTAQSVLGVTEAPADFLTWLLMEVVGRRCTIVGSMLSAAVVAAVLAVLMSAGSAPVAAIVVAFLCRCCATISLNVVVTYSMELLPTVVRSRAVGVTQTVGMVGAALSPAILSLTTVDHGLPAAVLSCVTLAGGAVFSQLPETLGQPLPNTLAEGEQFGSEQQFCSCFCRWPCAADAADAVDHPERTGCENRAADLEVDHL